MVAAIVLLLTGLAAGAGMTDAERYNQRTLLDDIGAALGQFSATGCELTAEISAGPTPQTDAGWPALYPGGELSVEYTVAFADPTCNEDESLGAAAELYEVDENGDFVGSKGYLCQDEETGVSELRLDRSYCTNPIVDDATVPEDHSL
jgi:hypothetical protein